MTHRLARLYIDRRLGHEPKYVLTDDPESLMNTIPDDVRKSVCFVGYKNPDGMFVLAGTAFFVAQEIEGPGGLMAPYAVTAKHVIDGMRDKGATEMGLRVNLKKGKAVWVKTHELGWNYHPDESQVVDVAVLGFAMPEQFDHTSLLRSTFVTPEQFTENKIGIGSEVFLAGLFANHYGETRNIPIVRVGNLIALPEEPVQTTLGFMDAYLIEARSLGGISGAPVFVKVEGFGIHPLSAPGTTTIGPIVQYFLLGLMHGHWNEGTADADIVTDIHGVRSVNMGIAIVIPISKVWEVITQPMIQKRVKESAEELRKQNLPQTDSLTDKRDDSEFTKESFENALKKASSQVSEPESEKTQTSE